MAPLFPVHYHSLAQCLLHSVWSVVLDTYYMSGTGTPIISVNLGNKIAIMEGGLWL